MKCQPTPHKWEDTFNATWGHACLRIEVSIPTIYVEGQNDTWDLQDFTKSSSQN